MLKEIVITIQSWGDAHRFISQHKLWKWVVIPGLLYTILFITAMYFFGKSATDVVEYITHILRLSDWIGKFQNSFLGFLITFSGIIFWLTLLLFYFCFFKYICLIIGSPIFAYLSRKTESIIEHDDHNPGWAEIKKEAGRGILTALRNCGWQAIYLIALLILSFIPIIGWVTPLIVLFMECYYYGYSMLDYSLARNKYSKSQSAEFIGRHKGLAIGNGILFYLMHLVIIFAPAYAIIAATLTVHKVKIISMQAGQVYLIPSLLDEKGIDAIPSYILDAVKECQVFFVENERTARRFLKLLWKEMVIDNYEWFTIHKAEKEVMQSFKSKLQEGKTIGILSEAGCPGVADPGQLLIGAAQEMKVRIHPLVGPSSILLALMASGMNGQQFQFVGYLPIDNTERIKTIRELEIESRKKNSTQIFIETPYRNNQLIEVLLKACAPGTRLCIAVDITGENEWIQTRPISDWKERPDIHKRPAIFLLLA